MKELEKFIRESINPKLCCEIIINDNLAPKHIEELKELLKKLS